MDKMKHIHMVGRHYGKSRRESAKQALRGEASLFWERTERLVFLAGFGQGRLERKAVEEEKENARTRSI